MDRMRMRYVFILAAAMIALLALCAGGVFEGARRCAVQQPADEFMWYYLPHEAGEPPKPMEKAPYVSEHRVIYAGCADEKKIYLTFDDCPDNGNIPKILDVLEKHRAAAAFFMNEAYIRQHPDVIERIDSSGSLVCNHTAKHVAVTRLTNEEFKAQLKGVEDAYFEVTGKPLPKFFRPPQGLFSKATLTYADELGYTTVFWSFRYSDWDIYNQPSESAAFQTIMDETHPGEIVLLHCQSKTNVAILDSLMSAWEKQGYSFGLINEIPINH